MRGLSAGFACAFALLALVPSFAGAKDKVLVVMVDGRAVDAKVPSGLLHHNVAFIDVVRGVKTFSGLLIFGKNDHSVNVTIRSHAGHFVVGSKQGTIDGNPVTFGAAPFNLYGNVYVPLAAFAKVAGVNVAVDTRHGVARLSTPQL